MLRPKVYLSLSLGIILLTLVYSVEAADLADTVKELKGHLQASISALDKGETDNALGNIDKAQQVYQSQLLNFVNRYTEGVNEAILNYFQMSKDFIKEGRRVSLSAEIEKIEGSLLLTFHRAFFASLQGEDKSEANTYFALLVDRIKDYPEAINGIREELRAPAPYVDKIRALLNGALASESETALRDSLELLAQDRGRAYLKAVTSMYLYWIIKDDIKVMMGTSQEKPLSSFIKAIVASDKEQADSLANSIIQGFARYKGEAARAAQLEPPPATSTGTELTSAQLEELAAKEEELAQVRQQINSFRATNLELTQDIQQLRKDNQELREENEQLTKSTSAGASFFWPIDESIGSLWAQYKGYIFILLAIILILLPLRYSTLAFGGTNPNPAWQKVGQFILLLTLPIFMLGIAYLISGLLQVVGTFVPSLKDFQQIPLSIFDVFRGTVAQILWVIGVLAAVFVGTAGLRDICAQFGLSPARGAVATVSDVAAEWEEEEEEEWDIE